MAEPARPASPRQVLLGLFILVQIAYLLFTNIVTYVKWAAAEVPTEMLAKVDPALPHFPKKHGHAWYWSEEIETAIRRYAQLTGQDQQWGLFAPVGKASGFPAVLMLIDPPSQGQGIDGATLAFDPRNGFHLVGNWLPKSPDMPVDPETPALELLLSDNEPADINSFIRIGNCRLRKYDGGLYLHMMPREGDTESDLAERMNHRTSDLLREYHAMTIVYLRWKMKAWKQKHPDRPEPKQVILLQRSFRIHDPDEPTGWDGPFMVPIGRWQPDPERSDASQLLESYDFNSQRFVAVK